MCIPVSADAEVLYKHQHCKQKSRKGNMVSVQMHCGINILEVEATEMKKENEPLKQTYCGREEGRTTNLALVED